jgi:hypothetical protein
MAAGNANKEFERWQKPQRIRPILVPGLETTGRSPYRSIATASARKDPAAILLTALFKAMREPQVPTRLPNILEGSTTSNYAYQYYQSQLLGWCGI